MTEQELLEYRFIIVTVIAIILLITILIQNYEPKLNTKASKPKKIRRVP